MVHAQVNVFHTRPIDDPNTMNFFSIQNWYSGDILEWECSSMLSKANKYHYPLNQVVIQNLDIEDNLVGPELYKQSSSWQGYVWCHR